MLLKRFDPGSWMADFPEPPGCLAWQVVLFRNLASLKFPVRMTDADRLEMLGRCREAFGQESLFSGAEYAVLSGLSDEERAYLLEERLLLPGFPSGPSGTGFFFPAPAGAVLLNGTEHITITAVGPSLQAVLEAAGRLDEAVFTRCEPAFSERLGFLTSQADYLGNGMRLTAFLHCPALRRAGRWRDILDGLEAKDMEVSGYPAGLSGHDFFLLSHRNAKYFLRAEEDMTADFSGHVSGILTAEAESSAGLDEAEVRDEIQRASGLMRSALRLGLAETIQALGLLLWGVRTGRVPRLSAPVLRSLLIMVQPGHLAALFGSPSLPKEREAEVRAQLVRARLSGKRGREVCRGT